MFFSGIQFRFDLRYDHAFGGIALMACLFLGSVSSPVWADGSRTITKSTSEGNVRGPAPVIVRPYKPASKRERSIQESLTAERASYRTKGTFGSLRGQAVALAAQFGRGGLNREVWWNERIREPLSERSGKPLHLGLEDLYQRTLLHSNQIKVLAGIPLIKETAIAEAEGEFSPQAYAESRYERSTEPSGSLLERSVPRDPLRRRGWTFEGGLKKKTRTGAQVALRQELSQEAENANYFVPGEQGRAKMVLSVMQPLLKGAGKTYNQSQIQIARLDTQSGYSEFIEGLEKHLLDVNELYWRLYLARGSLLEKQRLVEETEKVVKEIESRGELDSILSQRSRAQAALASRKAELIRADLEVKNAEARLRTLVSDPELLKEGSGEIIPADGPVITMEAPNFEKSVAEAVDLRPEIQMAESAILAADLREGIAENEKRPQIDFVGEFGSSAMRGSGDWTGAFNEQYNGGSPVWSVGLVGSISLDRKAEKAKLLRAQLEARQARDQLRATMDEVLLDVQIAHREVINAWPDARAKREAALAAEQELSVLYDRREVETQESGTSLYLEKLLDAQQRRATAREDFLNAIANYNVALTNLERAKGTLLRQENIEPKRQEDDRRLPIIRMVREEAIAQAKRVYHMK